MQRWNHFPSLLSSWVFVAKQLSPFISLKIVVVDRARRSIFVCMQKCNFVEIILIDLYWHEYSTYMCWRNILSISSSRQHEIQLRLINFSKSTYIYADAFRSDYPTEEAKLIILLHISLSACNSCRETFTFCGFSLFFISFSFLFRCLTPTTIIIQAISYTMKKCKMSMNVTYWGSSRERKKNQKALKGRRFHKKQFHV